MTDEPSLVRSFFSFARSLARSLTCAHVEIIFGNPGNYTPTVERRGVRKDRRIEEGSSFESSLNPCAAVPARCLGLAKRKAAASSSFFCRRHVMDAQDAVGGSRDFPEEPSRETFERLSGLTDFTESGFRAQSRSWEKKN